MGSRSGEVAGVTGRAWRLLVAASVACLAVAGCASDDGRSAGTTTVATTAAKDTASTSAETPPEAAAPEAASAVAARRGPSAGCVAPSPAAPGSTEVHFDAAGTDRWYLQRIPAAYDGSTPLPLVVDIHGYAEGAVLHSQMSAFGELGEQEGFITVFPHGQGSPPHWNANLGTDDTEVLGTLLDRVEAELCIDLARVYVAGFSNGAFMTSVLACEYAERIAAVAPLAGMRDVPGCEPARAVPAITFHGTVDDFVLYDGGFGAAAASLPAPNGSGETLGELGAESDENTAIVPGSMDQNIPDITAAWARRNGCGAEPAETSVAADVVLVDFDCPVGADLQLYRVVDGGHTWPGSQLSASLEAVMGRTTNSIDATATIWEFFSRNSLG
ncbi:MAG: hypothetical protein GX868_04010 [Actinobacteria bacterium]|nr:hypothetical protein [Actinomycetota bacterium]